MFKNCFITVLFFVSTYGFSQREYLFGQVVDSVQNEPIPFASIRVQDKALGVITNIDGTFKIPLRYKGLGEVLVISCLGYESREVNIQDLNETQSNIVILKPAAFELNEAVVSANIKKLSAKQIVKIAINSIPQNYPQSEFGLIGYYRDYQVKNGNYTNLNEALIKVNDEGFGKRNSYYNQYQLLSYDTNLDFEIDSFARQPYDYKGFNKIVPNAKMKNDGGNELITLSMHDALRNNGEESFSFIDEIATDFLETHRFGLKGKKNYKDQQVYEIDGTYRNQDYLARAKVFINADDFAIHKLDYAVYKRKKPNKQNIAVNANERFSDGFKKMNNEMIYHIQTEYARYEKGKMFLNYISFYNKILIQRPAAFKSRFLINLADRSFRIRMNKSPAKLNTIKKKDFKITYDNEQVPIKEFYYLEDERTFVVCPNLAYEKAEDLFDQIFTERTDLLVAEVKYSYGDIKDEEGNKLDERKWQYVHQYREFFTQETQTKSQKLNKENLMIKAMPLDSPLQPISNETKENEYWKNTPLPPLQSKKSASD